MIKILKACTASKATSFLCKYSIHDALPNDDPDKIGLGTAILKALNYYKIRGKFEFIHPQLREIGVTGVKVTNEGFMFIKNDQGLFW